LLALLRLANSKGNSSRNNTSLGFTPDEVVQSLNALIFLVVQAHGSLPDPEAGRRAVGEVVLAMRRDLLRKTHLDYTAFRYTDVYDEKN
jgi:hypothetical protein